MDEFFETNEEEITKLEEERKIHNNRNSSKNTRTDQNYEDQKISKQEGISVQSGEEGPRLELPGTDHEERKVLPKLSFIQEPEVQQVIDNKPRINFSFGDNEVIEIEGEEQESPTQGAGTPEQFNEGPPKLSLFGSANKIHLSLDKEGINLVSGHEIRKEIDTSPVRRKIREECK
mmetsp:Transcript_18771/g.18433  ORF Transcript_18771/g.18433 Transcript_18771/m.18433 type:complete len:175 (-) Transcript_18771:939-1463(-)